jgi:hypothetical protein
MARVRYRGAALAALWLVASVPLLAIEGKISDVRVESGEVRAAIDLARPFGDAQRAILERGGTLHVYVQAGVWEDRAVFDRVVESPRITTFRIIRQPNGAAIAVVNTGGALVTYKPYPDKLRLEVSACGFARLETDASYYVDGVVTIGTLSPEELEEANEAVFGRDEDPAGLKRVGKFLLNSVLQMKDYVDRVSTQVRSSRFTIKSLRP